MLLVTTPALSFYNPHLPEPLELRLENEKSDVEILASSFLIYLEETEIPAPSREALDIGVAGYLKLVNSGSGGKTTYHY